MSLDEFKATYVGKHVDFDGKLGFQCMDLIEEYNRDVVKAPRLWGNAIDLLKNSQPQFYDFIPNTPTYVPPAGSIAVWNNKVGNGDGHCAIVLAANVNSFDCIQQDGIRQTVTTVNRYYYQNVAGFLVVKVSRSPAILNPVNDELQLYKAQAKEIIKRAIDLLLTV
jgi:hypothetical protein